MNQTFLLTNVHILHKSADVQANACDLLHDISYALVPEIHPAENLFLLMSNNFNYRRNLLT